MTWNNARANAYLLYANYNTFFPHITGTVEIDLVKSHFNAGTGGAGVTTAAVGGLINGSNAINNANNANNLNNPINSVAVVGGGIGGGIGGTGAAATGTTGAVYNQFFITDISASYILLDFGGCQVSVDERAKRSISH